MYGMYPDFDTQSRKIRRLARLFIVAYMVFWLSAVTLITWAVIHFVAKFW